MTEVQGYTSDTGYVEDADENFDDDEVVVAEDDNPDGGPGSGNFDDPDSGNRGGNSYEPVPGSGNKSDDPGTVLHIIGDPPTRDLPSPGGGLVTSVQPEVDIDRDKDGFITKYSTSDGRELQVIYGDDHQPIAIVDDNSGSRMVQTKNGWVLETETGERVPLGDVSIDQETGAITTTFQDGSSVKAWPEGKVVQRDSDGNITAVSQINGNGKISVATARYDDQGDPVEVHDILGNTYLNQNGQWVERHANGSYTIIDGDISLTENGWTFSPKKDPAPQPAPQQARQ